MSSPTTIESHAPSYRRSFHYDRTPSPEPSLAGSRSEQPLSDGIALLPWNRVENFGALGPPRKQSGGSTRKWRQYLPAAPRLKSLLVVFLRSLRLIFLTAVGPWKTLQEQPKVAIYQQWLPAVLALSVHIIPLVAAVTMLLLNLKTTIVEHSISNTSLQYLAKALELLTQASISAAAFTYFRIIYSSGDGVPFGAITAGLQLSSLSYLWSLDLLGSLLSKSFQLRRKAVFAVFVLISILLTATVGPAIATCLIPRVQDITLSRNEAYFPDSEDTMYPAQIDADYVSDTCKSLNQSLTRNSICPFTGWGDLDKMSITSNTTPGVNQQLSYGVRRLKSYFFLDTPARFSVARASTVSLKPESSIIKRMKEELSPKRFLTAPSLRTLEHLNDELWDYYYNTDYMMYQLKLSWQEPSPVARAFCHPPDSIAENQTALNYRNPLDPASDVYIDVPSSKGSQDTDFYYKIHWSGSTTPGISVVAMVLSNNTVVLMCPIIAGWVNGTQSASLAQWPYTNDLSWSRDPVNISTGWAALLAPEFVDSRTSVIDSLLPRDTDILYYYANPIVAGLVVNGMSSYAYNSSLFDPYSWKNQSLSTKYRNTYTIYVGILAYSTKDLPVQLSLAVLATYVAYVLAFIIYTLGFSRSASFAWDSISELVALALLSKPPEKSLRNTRAGIETVELFKQHVHIRVVEDEKLELVFKDEDIGRPTSAIEPNQKY
ncbi:hypothetical protein HDK90DRAFT_526272, partial [Phyllosticta capitalensis]